MCVTVGTTSCISQADSACVLRSPESGVLNIQCILYTVFLYSNFEFQTKHMHIMVIIERFPRNREKNYTHATDFQAILTNPAY